MCCMVIYLQMFHTSMKTLVYLQQGLFTLFPRASAKANKTKSFTYNLDAYCTCRDVYFEEDIEKDESYFKAQCCSYDDWFHRKCLC